MSINFTRYNETGSILEVGTMSEEGLQTLVTENSWTYIEGNYDGATQMVDPVTREVIDRPSLNIEPSVEMNLGESVSYPLPDGAYVFMGPQPYPITDNVLTITPESAGEFVLSVVCPPYLPVTLKVTVNGT